MFNSYVSLPEGNLLDQTTILCGDVSATRLMNKVLDKQKKNVPQLGLTIPLDLGWIKKIKRKYPKPTARKRKQSRNNKRVYRLSKQETYIEKGTY